MLNLLRKEFKLAVNPFFYTLPFLTGALMLVPAWLYFLVTLYFCFITIPNMFGGFKSQNDLIFTSMLPVRKSDIVKAKIVFIVILELLHIGVASLYGLLSRHLYPHLIYFFYSPTAGFWGLSFVMLAIFNLIMFPMYYKTAYKFGPATLASVTGAVAFAGIAEWLGVQNAVIHDLFKGAGAANGLLQFALLLAGMAVFALCTLAAYKISVKRFEKVEM
ncbi:ABC-2 transporter permease [Paenibacillus athensensis]|uniref:ABC-2 transporter permease n=1 Tax=Paenibacillus athensensis TaxID=1967502 RepID=A0A4Y8Q880_9BACL|nr:ABC-2 transporter permease [Paenibacillus athensensis]MCD1260344.1 ABC-2 transporter permease [Paenibacillus athensensis]